jgi:hypothetical protein
MSCASSRHITNLSNLFLPFDIYGTDIVAVSDFFLKNANLNEPLFNS